MKFSSLVFCFFANIYLSLAYVLPQNYFQSIHYASPFYTLNQDPCCFYYTAPMYYYQPYAGPLPVLTPFYLPYTRDQHTQMWHHRSTNKIEGTKLDGYSIPWWPPVVFTAIQTRPYHIPPTTARAPTTATTATSHTYSYTTPTSMRTTTSHGPITEAVVETMDGISTTPPTEYDVSVATTSQDFIFTDEKEYWYPFESDVKGRTEGEEGSGNRLDIDDEDA